MQWPPCNTCVSTDRNLLFISHLIGCTSMLPEGVLPKKSLYGEAPSERGVPFSGFRYMKG